MSPIILKTAKIIVKTWTFKQTYADIWKNIYKQKKIVEPLIA
jgi:hypothetical protein